MRVRVTIQLQLNSKRASPHWWTKRQNSWEIDRTRGRPFGGSILWFERSTLRGYVYLQTYLQRVVGSSYCSATHVYYNT